MYEAILSGMLRHYFSNTVISIASTPLSDYLYSIFLFPGNSLHATHSLDLGGFCYIFFPLFGKKKYKLFFIFSREKFASHSLKKNLISAKKGPKKGTLCWFFGTFRIFEVYFFFPFFPKNFYVFFFSQEKFKIHSLTQIQEPGKKKIQHWKKK